MASRGRRGEPVQWRPLALGAVAVFDKPLDLDELAALTRHLLHLLHLPDPRLAR